MLKAEATGPRVLAIMGNADEANHQRLLKEGEGERAMSVRSPRRSSSIYYHESSEVREGARTEATTYVGVK